MNPRRTDWLARSFTPRRFTLRSVTPHGITPHGFTLIELLIALAVVAILSAIAWPGYGAVMQRAQRHDARLALMELQHAQERHYLRHFAYTGQLTAARADGGLGHSERAGDYRLSITLDADGQGYTVHAVPEPATRQARDLACARFTLDHAGRHAATDSSGADSTAACWR